MSNWIGVPSLEMLVLTGRAVALLLAFVLFAWGFMRWRRSAEKDTQRVFEQLDLVRADLLIMKEVMSSAAQRVDSAAKQVAHDVRLAPTQNAGAGRGYEIAARLARSGAHKEELIKSCGITLHEAELLVRLHGRNANAIDSTSSLTQTPIRPSIPTKPVDKLSELGKQIRRAPQPASPPPRAPQMPRSRLVAVG